MELKGNTILITGGTSGIGLGFAEALTKLGNKVIICGRREDRLKNINEKNPSIIIRRCDISDEKERRDLTAWIQKEHPSFNILINNAGIQTGQRIGASLDLQKVRQEVETNFTAPIHLCSLMVDHLKTKQDAAIINISSGLAYVPLAFLSIYCATKAGIHSFTLSLRYLLKDTKIKVFEVAPPAVNTELGQDRRADVAQSHGGISVEEFIEETIQCLKNDEYEAAIGTAQNLKEKKELLFNMLNK
jgi:uncharacterized oxidoreductase